MKMEGRLEGSDAPGIGFGGRGAIVGVLVLPNFTDRGSTRREQGWQVVASSMATAVARQVSARLVGVLGAADRRRGSHPRGHAGLVARHRQWGVALGPGILPMCRCSAFGCKIEEMGSGWRKGMTGGVVLSAAVG